MSFTKVSNSKTEGHNISKLLTLCKIVKHVCLILEVFLRGLQHSTCADIKCFYLLLMFRDTMVHISISPIQTENHRPLSQGLHGQEITAGRCPLSW